MSTSKFLTLHRRPCRLHLRDYLISTVLVLPSLLRFYVGISKNDRLIRQVLYFVSMLSILFFFSL